MDYNGLINASVWLAFIIMLPACSSNIPPEIRQELDNAPNVAQVREQLDSHIEQSIRWGGVILKTDNQQSSSKLTVIGLPLSSQGRPQQSDQSEGRFIAVVDEFLEPSMFTRDRQITVTGHILRSETQKVGDFSYEYPVVAVDQYYLWPKRIKSDYENTYPYRYYDPWYFHGHYYYARPYRYPYPYRLNRRVKH